MKPHFAILSFLSCVLIIFHVIYGGYAKGITITDGIMVYDNISEVFYFCGFSMFFFLYGYHVKDFGKTKNTLIIALLIIAFTLVSGISRTSQNSCLDYTGIIDGSWLVWFLPVLGVYLLTSIPISSRKVDLPLYYKAWVAVAMVVGFILFRICFHGIVDFKAYHFGYILFFLPVFYLGYFYRMQLEMKDYFSNYVRMSSWACASVLIIISLVFLRYMKFNLLGYSTIYEALLQIVCIVMTITLFASLKQRCAEMKIIKESTQIIQSSIPVVVIGALLYDNMIAQSKLVELLNDHFVLMPLAFGALLLVASYSIVLMSVIVYRMFVHDKVHDKGQVPVRF